MEHVTTPGQIIFLVALFVVFCVVAGLWLRAGIAEDSTPVDFDPAGIVGDAWHAILHWRPLPVKPSADSDPHVMSRSAEDSAPSIASSLETRPTQTPDQTIDPAVRRQKLLDTYRPLRKLGMSRDDARALLNAWNIPLDNNLWTEAGAALEREAAIHITPIVGRPTSARFEADPDYPYQALDA
jgi:hypothetical protein